MKYLCKDANISPCGTFRYSLFREWDREKHVLHWIMLNPSTADGKEDDPTIRRVVSFSNREGYGACSIFNLFALRATDPKEIDGHRASNDTFNDGSVRNLLYCSGSIAVVAGWGVNAKAMRYAKRLVEDYPLAVIHCLGSNQDGSPKHPLYVKGDTPLEVWGGYVDE